MSLNFAIPRIESPIMGNGGVMSRDWYLFFCAVLQTIGGPSVTPGGGIPPIEVQQQFEEYAITSVEAMEALRGVAELRNEFERGENPKIHDLSNAVDELRTELASVRGENTQLRSFIEEYIARFSEAPNNDLRNRVESIEDRLA